MMVGCYQWDVVDDRWGRGVVYNGRPVLEAQCLWFIIASLYVELVCSCIGEHDPRTSLLGCLQRYFLTGYTLL